jgi:hypothetical protein
VGLPGRTGNAAKYSAFSLAKHGLLHQEWSPAWRRPDLRASYDVVIVGGGVHGSPPPGAAT